MLIDFISLAILRGAKERAGIRKSYFSYSGPWRARAEWLISESLIGFDDDGFVNITALGDKLLGKVGDVMDIYDPDCEEWNAALTQFDKSVYIYLSNACKQRYGTNEETKHRKMKLMTHIAKQVEQEHTRQTFSETD